MSSINHLYGNIFSLFADRRPVSRRQEMFAAHNDVAFVSANFSLCAIDYRLAVAIDAQIHSYR